MTHVGRPAESTRPRAKPDVPQSELISVILLDDSLHLLRGL